MFWAKIRYFSNNQATNTMFFQYFGSRFKYFSCVLVEIRLLSNVCVEIQHFSNLLGEDQILFEDFVYRYNTYRTFCVKSLYFQILWCENQILLECYLYKIRYFFNFGVGIQQISSLPGKIRYFSNDLGRVLIPIEYLSPKSDSSQILFRNWGERQYFLNVLDQK